MSVMDYVFIPAIFVFSSHFCQCLMKIWNILILTVVSNNVQDVTVIFKHKFIRNSQSLLIWLLEQT